MVSSGLEQLDRLLGGDGYPDRSTILVAGPPGVGKEALGYWFAQSGLLQGDFCLYVSTLTAAEILKDFRAYHVDTSQRVPMWITPSGGELKCNVNDLTDLSFNIKETLRKNGIRRQRVVTDILSSLLMLNNPDIVYRFFSQLFADVKLHDAVFLATIEVGMHDEKIIAAMEQLFDGVLELRLYEKGMRLIPLLRIKKMRGTAPEPVYYQFSFQRGKMEISSHVR